MPSDAARFIVFFDGQCGLCDRSVRLLMKLDRQRVLRFAPLQGETYAELAIADKPADVSTIVVLDDGEVFVRSDAVLQILRRLGGVWKLLAFVVGAVPQPARDAAYRFIAKHRLRVFGGADACKLPSPAEGEQLLP